MRTSQSSYRGDAARSEGAVTRSEVVKSISRYLAPLLGLGLSASLAACGPGTRGEAGTVTVQIDGEEAAKDGFSFPTGSEVTISDGSEPPARLPGLIHWTGTIPPQKWMTFYTKVLSRFANTQGLKLRVDFQVPAPADEAQAKALAEAAQAGLRDLGLEVPDTLLE